MDAIKGIVIPIFKFLESQQYHREMYASCNRYCRQIINRKKHSTLFLGKVKVSKSLHSLKINCFKEYCQRRILVACIWWFRRSSSRKYILLQHRRTIAKKNASMVSVGHYQTIAMGSRILISKFSNRIQWQQY